MNKKDIFSRLDDFEQKSLYSFNNEHDACGVGLAITLNGEKSHSIIEKGLQVLENMVHRGAESSDNITGDGAGILVQIPHEFILLQGIAVPSEGKYGTGLVFLPKDAKEREDCIETIKYYISKEQLTLLHIRDVPVNSECLGEIALSNEPVIKQLFISGSGTQDELDRKLYLLRKKIENHLATSKAVKERSFYIVSLSTKQMIYKGMLTSIQLRQYFPDLSDKNFTSRLALVHSRFSTNTFPTWDLAQPFRMLAHNGEINTIRGNRQWMKSRESVLKSEQLGDLTSIYPIVQPDMSDSASIDNVLEFLLMSGKSLPHAMAMLVPESFNDKNPIPNSLKAFYEYHSMLMEPWDGPATLLFSDGRYAGGMLDRNGLRPARYTITHEGVMIIASETGTIEFDASDIKSRGRLKPGKMIIVDTYTGKIYSDKEVKAELANAFPYREWLNKNCINLDDISSGRSVTNGISNYETLLKIFGYSVEDINMLINPMASDAKEPVSSMGNDVTIAPFSEKPQRLFNYFRQQFAQVTNPPIDPIREELVMSLTGYIGAINQNFLEEIPEMSPVVKIKGPVISNSQFDILLNLRYKGFSSAVVPMLFDPKKGSEGLTEAIDQLCLGVEKAIDEGKNYIVLSDRGVDENHAPIPSLLATSAVHLYLVEKRKRMQIDIVVESAEPREVMHFALLFGFGANAVNPYMIFAILEQQVRTGQINLDIDTAKKNYIKSVNKGLLKVLSKMGNSTLRSYRGAHIFEALGISSSVLNRYFKSVSSKIEGIDIDDIVNEVLQPFSEAYNDDNSMPFSLKNEGRYAYRVDGEFHAWNPETIAGLQIATKTENYTLFKEYCEKVNNKPKPVFIRDLIDYKNAPIDISEVEPVESIMKRFCTGAMSYGSISKEAHEALAMAMNIIGGRSNTGEGGEDPSRYRVSDNGLSKRSSIKQVASGRFGVTTEYLVNADELQIKIAQGAKPGEGGQLPGYKVDEIIAKTRHSIPGISLISPPPHHDIYSIEDLAQLIFDLKNVNPRATVSVKLVSETGVGTIAAGVAKAKADLIVISGSEGGTGASPASSIKHAGMPLEIGLAETHQTLVINNLRGKVKLQTDGQLKTGRDIVIASMLGAEEFGFATSALIVLGCVMMRKCHLNTCPVGIATQNADLRKQFKGHHEQLVCYFRFLAENTREELARLGFKSLDDIIGRSDLLIRKHYADSPKTDKVDISRIIYFPEESKVYSIRNKEKQLHKIDEVLDKHLIAEAMPAIELKHPIGIKKKIKNTDRTTGAMLSGEIALRYGNDGLPEHTISAYFEGSAGQSFGAFLVKGVTFYLHGDTNDYMGKGLSGGRIIITPPRGSTFNPEENIICGNTTLYGATSGEVFINGVAGERFAVRNSGATAVVEGAGDHCCEYMTGGIVVVLGQTGRNFAAGMSGGVAYVLDESNDFDYFCNMEMVELSLVEDNTDINELKTLIYKHQQYTNSNLAKKIISNWEQYVLKFKKVTPIEYKKVLQEKKIRELDRKIAVVERDY
ncbi:MAG TPA: glutamate synthase large subunit [Fermentimonas caenicola]|jgi:glutamate synthase (NADPH/NADH) large chain|uniref:glutamate synthase large subunit n=1 Tax=Lascolabacillus sp. TaxID=1924068 RepID=UPI001224E341|nr:glutamate synthase large subunit [Lascolabacillus sp.]MBP6196190.1 glutamate synthase large subunit [Fermentimonas sp.]MDI9626596.1 glutamate synthase large subunit [Bacteroidota bacterium]TAH62127.1 MAG: glutamate synthase large subunit [Fermentimonas caenicola]MBP7104069.1 glutamate synthase large subunit [Fermentimonas sp.]MDD2607429.1 glutamate synthase large subunit [Lascolabacillus sp.]